jgi:penicillin G amidase
MSGNFGIARDEYGIPHVTAGAAEDVWEGMGFACAQDRWFQLDYDRRRACGRWAEVAGQGAVPADALARRMGLAAAAKRDVEAMSAGCRAAFEAYARGVNLAAASAEPWEPWHSVAAFKVRHVLMGQWQHKLAQAIVLAKAGAEAFGQLRVAPPAGSPLAVPPDGRLAALLDEALHDITGHLGFLAEAEPGSNAWAVSAARTSSGTAIICNDSHRALDVPNVYWQCRVTCPDFDVVGATFPGLPGFPHFGFNGHVAWAITHADADTQDLYLEQFDGDRYLTESGWVPARRRTERIMVRDGDPVDIEAVQTRHGPIVHGSPERGMAIALKYTATWRADRGFECLLPMLLARDVTQLADAQNGWVDPVNNLLAADTGGRIAYQCRGTLPVRSSPAHRRLPVPGWDGACEWTGTVPFKEMPRVVDPGAGFVMTANNVIVEGDEPYISSTFTQPFRAERIREHLISGAAHTAESLAAMQADTVSWAARAWARLLAGLPVMDAEASDRARRMLADWDGDLAAGSAPALLYACFQRALADELYRPLLGDDLWEWVAEGSLAPTITLVRRWLANDTWDLLGGPRPAPASATAGDGASARRVLAAVPAALARAWASAVDAAGPDSAAWRWGEAHQALRVHPLAGHVGSVPMGGDADTIQAAGYAWLQGMPFTVTNLSVYRQVVDLGDPDHASYVIPGGSSADPASPHFADQLTEWSAHRRLPMRPPA